MKTLFGMTAAVLMVAALSGMAAGGECFPGTTRFLDEKPIHPARCENGLLVQWFLPRHQLCGRHGTWDGIILGKTYEKVIGECICQNGDVKVIENGPPVQKGCKLYQDFKGERCVKGTWVADTRVKKFQRITLVPNGNACIINDCPGTCQNGVCKKKNALAAAMTGDGGTCGCSVCTECQTCKGNKCVPIENPSPSNPKCLKK
jgi:hypothetical protein